MHGKMVTLVKVLKNSFL